MHDYHLNIFRPYHHDFRNEMSVTRAFIIACSKSPNGTDFLQKVLKKVGVSLKTDGDGLNFGLEVPGDSGRGGNNYSSKIVLCISPYDEIAQQGILSELFDSEPDKLQLLSNVVLSDAEQPDLEKFKNRLVGVFPNIQSALSQTGADVQMILNAAYWDTWRLLYSGARVDALIQNVNMCCLIESKIWGNVYEVQARNHAIEFFKTMDIPLYAVSWQTIYDMAKDYDDFILADFVEYLAEFPQLVRWNGFDFLDLKAFEMNAGNQIVEPLIQNRLRSRYWQCMEELCNTFNYKVSARRAVDWDFTPNCGNLIGNTGIGYWDSGTLSAKWCVGYHAWEMDNIMSGQNDLMQRGNFACEKLAAALQDSYLTNDLSIEMRAVQRFQFANAMDGTWFDGSSCSVSKDGNISDALRKIWKHELDLLMEFHSRRGKELSSAHALAIKRQIFDKRHPGQDSTSVTMRTRNQKWRLFAALDVFVNINPSVFLDESTDSCMPKSEQLEEMNKIVTSLASFAKSISR